MTSDVAARALPDAIHDMRNLLGIISGQADMMLATLGPGDPLRNRVHAIRTAVASSRALTWRLLGAEDARETPAGPVAVDVNALVADVAGMLDGVLGAGIALEVRAGRPIPAVRGIRADLEHALVNLAVNAAEAMPDGGRLTIETAFTEVGPGGAGDVPPGSWVAFAVSDTGVGMDPGVLGRAFEPCFTTKPGPGRGLGLVGVEAAVRRHGGIVRLHSTPGAGSCFRVFLPVVAAPRTRAGAATVLIVEQESDIRDLVAEILQSNGYRALVTATADEALSAARQHPGPIDALVADVTVPGVPIPDLVTAVRQARPGLAVVYMSGQPEAEVLRRAAPLAGPLLRKPFGISALLDTIRTALA